MERKGGLIGAKALLLAIHFAAKADLESFLHLVSKSQPLSFEIALRVILTFLPGSTQPEHYVPALQKLAKNEPAINDRSVELDTSAIDDLSDGAARTKARHFKLLPLQPTEFIELGNIDLLSAFLIHRAYRVDEETGLLSLIGGLIVPFVDHSEALRTWFISTLLPLLRITYEYYPNDYPSLNLREFSDLDVGGGLELLVGKSKSIVLGRDLRSLYGPWAYGETRRKRRRISSKLDRPLQTDSPITQIGDVAWEQLNRWLVSTSHKDFEIIHKAMEDWQGPMDTNFGGFDNGKAWSDQSKKKSCTQRFSKALLASIYNSQDVSKGMAPMGIIVLSRVAALMNFKFSKALQLDSELPPRPLADFKKQINAGSQFRISDLKEARLLDDENLVTQPQLGSAEFLLSCLETMTLMQSYGRSYKVSSLAQLCLFATQAEQENELKILIHDATQRKMIKSQWETFLDHVLWIWKIGRDDTASKGVGIFGHVRNSFVHAELLRGSLITSHFKSLSRFIHPGGSLSPQESEKLIYDVAMTFYDNASNGNRTRGGIKRSNEVISAFYPSKFPESTLLSKASALISATHSLSFYALKLQHNVPFTPVNIRITSDPLGLIKKVLEQNPRSYANVDDITNIGRNIAAAGLLPFTSPSQTLEALMTETERRVLVMCIEASLSASDFETAYSFVVNRLNHPNSSSTPPHEPDLISYHAAFIAGRYRTPEPSQRILEMRLELLSTALLLAPAPALPEILAAWRRAEEELNSLRAAEEQEGEEDEWQSSLGQKRAAAGLSKNSSQQAPGAEGASSREAPMGLFDVARGAAKAFGKTAFPLGGATAASAGGARGAAKSGGGGRSRGQTLGEGDEEGDDEDGDSKRVRKRDMVSDMVTGGLASGIGWVLGAQPVSRPGGGQDG